VRKEIREREKASSVPELPGAMQVFSQNSPVFERTSPLPRESDFEKAYAFGGYITIAPFLFM
jgi:hypothetical protein